MAFEVSRHIYAVTCQKHVCGLALLHIHQYTDIDILEIVREFDTCGRRIGFLRTPEPHNQFSMFQMYFEYEYSRTT